MTHDTTDFEAFCKIISEIERLCSLAHDEDETNHTLSTILLTEIEGHDCALHEQAKHGIEHPFTVAMESILDSIEKYEAYTHHRCQRYKERHEIPVLDQEGEE